MLKKSDIFLLSVLAAFFLLLLAGCSSKGPTDSNTKVPVLTTASVSTITQTTAQCGGTITSDGGATITARGVCWSTSQTPTITDSKTTEGSGTGSFTSSITDLTGGITYYVRAYATNSAGTGYGNLISFMTDHELGTVMDVDGNIYKTVKIGTQWWMADNLRAIHYRNGHAIPKVTDSVLWARLTTGAYCDYDNIMINASTYGHLYNWFAINDSRDIAPRGWHLPNDAEWQTLINYLGGSDIAGGKMKETGTTHWNNPNIGATNESGFTALPGGFRGLNGGYSYFAIIGSNAYFWSSTESDSHYACSRLLVNSSSVTGRGFNIMQEGLSVRCVKD